MPIPSKVVTSWVRARRRPKPNSTFECPMFDFQPPRTLHFAHRYFNTDMQFQTITPAMPTRRPKGKGTSAQEKKNSRSRSPGMKSLGGVLLRGDETSGRAFFTGSLVRCRFRHGQRHGPRLATRTMLCRAPRESRRTPFFFLHAAQRGAFGEAEAGGGLQACRRGRRCICTL